MNRVVSITVLFVLIVLLGATFYHVIAPFLMPIFLAAVMAVICRPIQDYFMAKVGNRRAWAAGLTTATVVSAIVVPMGVGTCLAALNLYTVADRTLDGDWRHGIDQLWSRIVEPGLAKVGPYIPGGLPQKKLDDLQMDLEKNLQSLASNLAGKTFTIASSTVGLFVSLVVAAGMFITAFYYFLADGPEFLKAARELIPLPADHQERLAIKFAATVRAVVTATFIAAFAQGIATALALQFVGLGHFILFLVVASIASLIPLAGAWMVWGPCAAWLALQGNWTAAIGLTIWGIAFVGMLDNGVKIYVLQNDADLHPLLAFVSVIGALQVFGLWGIFIGPIVASCLYALIQIFNEELNQLAKDRKSSEPTPAMASVPVSSLLAGSTPAVAHNSINSSEVQVTSAPNTKTSNPSKQRKKRN